MTAVGNITSLAVGERTPYVPSPKDREPAAVTQKSGINVTDYIDTIDLSDSAKRVVNAQDSAQNTTPFVQSKDSGDQVSILVRISQKVADAKRLVQGKVGIDGVSTVVDGFGNIDTAKLAQIQAEQVKGA